MKRGVIATVVAAVLGFLALLGRILWDVFSLAGVAYSFGLSDGADLAFPTVTAVAFWLLTVLVPLETAVLVTKRLDWRDGRLEPRSPMDGWLAAHISLKLRVQRRVVWLVDGRKVTVKQKARAAELAKTPALPVVVTAAPVDTPATTAADAA